LLGEIGGQPPGILANEYEQGWWNAQYERRRLKGFGGPL
jgi:hypothetical protein